MEVDNLSPILGFENESFDRDLLMFGKNYLESNQDEETSLQTLLECEYQFTIGVQMIEWIDKWISDWIDVGMDEWLYSLIREQVQDVLNECFKYWSIKNYICFAFLLCL